MVSRPQTMSKTVMTKKWSFLLEPHHLVIQREALRLDVRVVSLCHACFPVSLREGLRLDVRLISLCHNMTLSIQQESVTGKIQNKYGFKVLNHKVAAYIECRYNH